MTARNAVVVGAVCASLTLTLGGCGGPEAGPDAGTNGVAKLSAAKIQRKAKQAAEKAIAVRLSGTVVVRKGRTYKLNMQLRRDGGFGHLVTKGSTFRLLRIDDNLYLKADAAFWAGQDKKAGSDSVARKLDDKYVKVPKSDPAYKQLSGFTDMKVLLDGLIALHGKLGKGDRGEVDGTQTIRITGDEGAGGSLDVSLKGDPHPLRLQRAGGAGTLRLTSWNKSFALKAPAESQVVDYGHQISAG